MSSKASSYGMVSASLSSCTSGKTGSGTDAPDGADGTDAPLFASVPCRCVEDEDVEVFFP